MMPRLRRILAAAVVALAALATPALGAQPEEQRDSTASSSRSGPIRLDSLSQVHQAIHAADAHPHLAHARSMRLQGFSSGSASVGQHAIRLQAGTLDINTRMMQHADSETNTADSSEQHQAIRAHHSLSTSGASRRPPHRVFNSQFFHGAGATMTNAALQHRPRLLQHTLRAAPAQRGDGSEPPAAADLNLHVPSSDTFDVMQAYFTASGESLANEFADMYSEEDSADAAAAALPSIDSEAHPLHSHPKFHYQWLVTLKSPVTSQAVAEVERMIAPYKLQHFIPHNSYLVSLPYAMALKLRTGVAEEVAETEAESEAPSLKRGPVLFICMYHPAMKVQQNLAALLLDRWQQKTEIRAEDEHNAKTKATFGEKAHPKPQRTLAHEIRLTFTHPHFDATHAAATSRAANFPQDRDDMALMEAYASKQEKFWNNHPRFLDEMAAAAPSAAGVVSKGIQFHAVDSHQILVRLPSELNISSSDDSFLSLVLAKISSHHSVQYIESSSLFRTSNKHAKYVVQANLETGDKCTDPVGNLDLVGIRSRTTKLAATASATQFDAPFYSLLNLRGQDHLLTIGDTGVDFDSCWFYDVNHPDVETNSRTLSEHRKIAAYVTSPTTDSRTSRRANPGDDEGHGSHTAGSLAAEVTSAGFPANGKVDDFTFQSLANYNGVSSASRLIIFDFQNPGDSSLYVPSDVYRDYLLVSYNYGSRIGSNSWGDDSGHYDTYARDVDSFLYSQPDYLMVMAAGNLGARGLHTIASPAVAKNLLTVGSSLNGVCSFYDQGMATGIVIRPPHPLAGNYSVTPATFGPSFITMTQHKDLKVCYANPPNACAPLVNAAECAGKLVFVERLKCTFTYKAHMVEMAGGVLMGYLHDDPTPNYIIDGDGAFVVRIPSVTFAQSLASQLRPILLSNPGSLSFDVPTYLPSLSQSEHALSDFSGKGPTLDGRIKPDVLAPGELIESMKSDKNLHSFQCRNAQVDAVEGVPRKFKKDAVIHSMQGTSMAAPIAAGAASLVRQYFTGGHYKNLATGSAGPIVPSSALIKAAIISGTSAVGGTTPVPGEGNGRPNVEAPPSYHQGFGRLEMSESLAYDIPASITTNGKHEKSKYQLHMSDSVWIATGDVHQYCFRVTDGSVPFKATLVWTDPPPLLAGNLFLVNNLDLLIVGYNTSTAPTSTDGQPTGAPTHEVFIGNQRLHASTKHQLLFDVNNNVEKAVVDAPVVDRIYSVVVRGTNVPVSGPASTINPPRGQMYALVVNGRFSIVGAAECPAEVYCPNDCSGHGQCVVSAAKDSTNAPAQSTPPNTGVCQCEAHWAGADCSIAAIEIVVTAAKTGKLTLEIPVDQWIYVYYDVRSGDRMLDYTIDRVSGGKGDPDFYWTTPNMAGAATAAGTQLNYPTLGFYKYVNSECDSCGKTHHVQKLVTNDLYPASDTMRVGGGTVMLGIFGYCCTASTITVTLAVTR